MCALMDIICSWYSPVYLRLTGLHTAWRLAVPESPDPQLIPQPFYILVNKIKSAITNKVYFGSTKYSTLSCFKCLKTFLLNIIDNYIGYM